MNTLLAISGGIDSMSMLALAMRHFQDGDKVLVAHYNHKMRPSADDDAEFVRKWAEHYQLPFYYDEARPGEIKSEEQARAKRYNFLYRVAKETNSEIYTAHHKNDLVETVAINILRGTGWRGLAPFSNKTVHQFFFEFPYTKKEVYKFAGENEIVFRQDPTNNEDTYLRNRVRQKIGGLNNDDLQKIWQLYVEQQKIATEIDGLVEELLPKDGHYEREWFKEMDDKVALEILRAGLIKAGVSATRPQIADFLEAIRTYAPEKKYNLPDDKLVALHKTYFVLKSAK